MNRHARLPSEERAESRRYWPHRIDAPVTFFWGVFDQFVHVGVLRPDMDRTVFGYEPR